MYGTNFREIALEGETLAVLFNVPTLGTVLVASSSASAGGASCSFLPTQKKSSQTLQYLAHSVLLSELKVLYVADRRMKHHRFAMNFEDLIARVTSKLGQKTVWKA